MPSIAKNKVETAVINCKSQKLEKFNDQKKMFSRPKAFYQVLLEAKFRENR